MILLEPYFKDEIEKLEFCLLHYINDSQNKFFISYLKITPINDDHEYKVCIRKKPDKFESLILRFLPSGDFKLIEVSCEIGMSAHVASSLHTFAQALRQYKINEILN